LFQRFGARFQEAVETSRGAGEDDLDEPVAQPVAARPAPAAPARPVEEPVSPRSVRPEPARMTMAAKTVIPEGVVISGSLTSSSDTEVSGKIEGDVVVEGRLHLGTSALISGNVKATLCRVDGMVDGKVECTQDLEIGETGRLTADAIASRNIVLAGQVTGHVSTGGQLRLLPTARIAGDIRAKSIVIEEGAFFNGKCIMRPSGENKPAHAGDKKD
jgi:cytoskeletal protein CcmA (bactofilin family)